MSKVRNYAALLCLAGTFSATASAAIMYDQDVTPDAIFGSGNANGSYTVDRSNGVELGLRGKLRHNESGNPENTFNSNGDGTYSFVAGSAVGQSPVTAVWSVEWSINTDYLGETGWNLNDLEYVFAVDQDASAGTNFVFSDVINGQSYYDHSIGTNATGNGGGTEAADANEYANLIDNNNVAQNSRKAHWIIPSFDPTISGVYDFMMTALNNGQEIASTRIQIIVGDGATDVPEPAGILLLSGLAGIGLFRRKKA